MSEILKFDNDPISDLYARLKTEYGEIKMNQYPAISMDIETMLEKNQYAVDMIQYEIVSRIMRLRATDRSEYEDGQLNSLEEMLFLPQTMVELIKDYLKPTSPGGPALNNNS